MRVGGETSSTRISGYEFDEVSNRNKLTTNAYNGIGDGKTLTATSTVDYVYNNADELTEETTTVGANTTTKTYAYDDNGAQTSVTVGSVTTPYVYDFEGKLTSVGDATSSTRSSYVYDGDGNRLSAIVTTGGVAKTVRYLNNPDQDYVQVLEERDENDTLQARYEYGDDSGEVQKLYRRDDNGNYLSRWYLGDGLESTRQLVDANGVVTDSYAYDAFGATLQHAGETQNTRLYNGQQQDNSGLYFLRARYYNSGNGRFLSHDPLLGNSDDPVTLHRYLYAGADSVNFTDPNGEAMEPRFRQGLEINDLIGAHFQISGPDRFADFWRGKRIPFNKLFPNVNFSAKWALMRPDLVDFQNKKFFDVTDVSYTLKAIKILLYQEIFDFADSSGWKPGEFVDYFPPTIVGPVSGGFFAIVAPPVRGVIFYKKFRRSNMRDERKARKELTERVRVYEESLAADFAAADVTVSQSYSQSYFNLRDAMEASKGLAGVFAGTAVAGLGLYWGVAMNNARMGYA